MTFCSFFILSIDLLTVLLFVSILKSVGIGISLHQVVSHFFGVLLQHSLASISTGAGPRILQTNTPSYPMDYTCASNTLLTKACGTSSSKSDSGVEMKEIETQPHQPVEMKELPPSAEVKVNTSSLRHRVKDRSLSGAGGNG